MYEYAIQTHFKMCGIFVCIHNIYVALLSLLQNILKNSLPLLFTGPTKALQPGGANHAA